MSEVFHITPFSARGLSLAGLIILGIVIAAMLFAALSIAKGGYEGPLQMFVIGLVGLALSATIHGARRTTFELGESGLRIRGDIWRRAIPYNELSLGEARIADLNAETDLRPKWKTMGTSIPGYQAGWFRLRNGEKALIYLTDMARVVCLPTRSNYKLLMSISEPDRFIETLQRIQRRGG